MVGIDTLQGVDVNRRGSAIRKRLKELANEVDIKVADTRTRVIDAVM